MHPLQTFSGVGVPPLEGKVFAVEGDVTAVRAARQIARALRRIPSAYHGRKKILYHAAAALAAWHVLALVEAATRATESRESRLPPTRAHARRPVPLRRDTGFFFSRDIPWESAGAPCRLPYTPPRR